MRTLTIAFICFALLMLACCGTLKEPRHLSLNQHSTDTNMSKADINTQILSNPLEPSLPAPQQTPVKVPTPQRGLVPKQLEIPTIHLKARVEKVGRLPSGAMDVPKAFDRVGLLYPAYLPGENGNAVIDGHVDHYTGPAIFFYLKRLKPGDKVIVSEENKSLIFIVKSVEAFNTGEAPLHRIFGPAHRPRLNLITCTGKFNKKTQEHDKRLVIFTEIEHEM
jgi:LPXTG-site transpeptidase (sortase) family protein